MGRPHFMGEPVMAQSQDRSHARAVFGGLAGITGAVLIAAFVAPFYGALDRPVVVINSGDTKTESGTETASSSNSSTITSRGHRLKRAMPRRRRRRNRAKPPPLKGSGLRGKRTARSTIR